MGSDTTKDRFISSYHLPDQALIRSSELFNSVVLELVKLIQAALAVFGMFDLDREARDGLLCDVTWEGIQRWVAEIGEPLLSVEVSLAAVYWDVPDSVAADGAGCRSHRCGGLVQHGPRDQE